MDSKSTVYILTGIHKSEKKFFNTSPTENICNVKNSLHIEI